MQIKLLKKLIKRIVSESMDMMRESHDRGEWWIESDGNITYADGDFSDADHETVVIKDLCHEILSHFGIEEINGLLGDYENDIKRILLNDGRLTEKELEDWEQSSGSKCPYTIILNKLIEDKLYSTPEQTQEALSIAYNSGGDPRDYAMKYWNWKIMKTFGSNIEIQTWHLKPDDLGIIVRGVEEIINWDEDNPDDPDNEIGEDNFTGPRVNVTVQSLGKRYVNIPLEILKKKVPTSLLNYRSGVNLGIREGIDKKNYHHFHNEYRLYEGHNKVIAVFEDNSRLSFKIHYRDNHGEDKEKWRKKACTTWKSLANEIHGDVQLSDGCNPIQKSWKESFEEALNHPKLKEFIITYPHKKVFP